MRWHSWIGWVIGWCVFWLIGASPTCLAAMLTPFDGQTYNDFGCANSLIGNAAAVGAKGDGDNGSNSGAVYVFRRNDGNWVGHQKVYAPNPDAQDQFGSAVDLSGDVLVVGAPTVGDTGISNGAVYVYAKDGDRWAFHTQLSIDEGPSFTFFGDAVALSGDLLIVGAPGDGLGAAYIFRHDGTQWIQEARLVSPNDTCLNCNVFAGSVSISGELAMVGSPRDDEKGLRAGAAFVYRYHDDTWQRHQKLMDPDGGAEDEFGGDVAVDGDWAIIGVSGYNKELAVIYRNIDGVWTPVQRLTPFNPGECLNAGKNVDIQGDYAILGPLVYRRIENDWVLHTRIPAEGDLVAGSAAVGADQAIVGVVNYTAQNSYWAELVDLDETKPLIRQTIADQLQYVDFGVVAVADLDAVFMDPNQQPLSYQVAGDGDVGCFLDGNRLMLESTTGFTGLSTVTVTASNGTSTATLSFDVHVIPDNKIVGDGYPLEIGSFGSAMAVCGDVAVIGAPGEKIDDIASGAAYIFMRDGARWIRQAKLLPSLPKDGDAFGSAVAICQNHVAVLAQEGVNSTDSVLRIFYRDGTDWIEQAALQTDKDTYDDHFDSLVVISDEYAVINALPASSQGDDASPSIYVFKCEGGAWAFQDRLTADQPVAMVSRFGTSMVLDGHHLTVGATEYDSSNILYHVQYDFEEVAGTWVLQSKSAISGDEFQPAAAPVSISGDRILAGDDDAEWVRLYETTESGTILKTTLTAGDGCSGDHFGDVVLLKDDFAIVGAPYDDQNGGNTGSAYVFINSQGMWYLQRKVMPGSSQDDTQFARCIASDGHTLLLSSTNAVYVYELSRHGPYVKYPLAIQIKHEGFEAFELPDLNTIFGDPDGDSLFFTVLSDGNTRATLTGSTLTIAPEPDYGGTGSIIWITATDGQTTTEQAVRVIIAPNNVILPDSPNTTFASQVATSGNIVIIGATGHAAIYGHQANIWQQESVIADLSGPLAVDISGDHAIIGSYTDQAATIVKKEENSWVACARLLPSAQTETSHFGISVAIADSYAIVGGDVVDQRGRIHIYKKALSGWSLQAVVEDDADEGNSNWGYKVDMTDDYAIVGGAHPVSIYQRAGEIWSLQAELEPYGDYVGLDVAIFGHYAMVGYGGDYAEESGAKVYRRYGDAWNLQATLDPPNYSGSSWRLVDIYGNYAILGGFHMDRWGFTYGANRLYQRSGDTWSEVTDGFDMHTDTWDYWTPGRSVAVAERFALVGVLGAQALTDDACTVSSGGVFASDELDDPLYAEAGPNQTVSEGTTVCLDGFDSAGPIDETLDYQWAQAEGPDIVLSDPASSNPFFVTPSVGAGGRDLIFTLTVTDQKQRTDHSSVGITIQDNGITDFADDVLPFPTATDESMGIRIEQNGNLVVLTTIAPETLNITGSENLPYGLIETTIRVGESATAVPISLFFSEPLPEAAVLRIYRGDGSCKTFDEVAFDQDRRQLTILLKDGDGNDADSIQNGEISAIMSVFVPDAEPPPASDDGGGSCFIGTL